MGAAVPPVKPDFPTQLDNIVKGVHTFMMTKAPVPVQQTYVPFATAIFNWVDTIAEQDLTDSAKKILGGFMGGIVAGGIRSSAKTWIMLLERDATT